TARTIDLPAGGLHAVPRGCRRSGPLGPRPGGRCHQPHRGAAGERGVADRPAGGQTRRLGGGCGAGPRRAHPGPRGRGRSYRRRRSVGGGGEHATGRAGTAGGGPDRGRGAAAGAPVGLAARRAAPRPGGPGAGPAPPAAGATGFPCPPGGRLSHVVGAALRGRPAAGSGRGARRVGRGRGLGRGAGPGGADEPGTGADPASLRARFLASEGGDRVRVEAGAPCATDIGGVGGRGRIDAVFANPDGSYEVVDWKTGRRPTDPDAVAAASVQLATYRLAWAALAGVPVARVRAAFHYVAEQVTLRPVDL